MRRVFYMFGFLLALILAASSFATILGDTPNSPFMVSEQTYLVPRSNNAGIDECLANRMECGHAAAASICVSKGYTQVVEYGIAAPEDMTGSTGDTTAKPVHEEMPFTITCTR
jgi:hypothetical protein